MFPPIFICTITPSLVSELGRLVSIYSARYTVSWSVSIAIVLPFFWTTEVLPGYPNNSFAIVPIVFQSLPIVLIFRGKRNKNEKEKETIVKLACRNPPIPFFCAYTIGVL